MEKNLNNEEEDIKEEANKKPVLNVYINDKGEINYTTNWGLIPVEIAQQLVKVLRESASSYYF